MKDKVSASSLLSGLASGYNVVVSSIAIAIGTVVEVARANNQRWGLIFVHQAAPNVVAVLPEGFLASGVPGFEVVNSPPYTTFTQRDHPALTSMSWEATASANSVLTVIEIIKL